MATSLTQGITSEYISAANSMRSSGNLPQVFVYVEGLDDIAFWNACLQPYSRRYEFKINQLRRVGGGLAEGKTALIEEIDIQTLGPYKLIAVDSDYDWIIDNYRTSLSATSYSRQIRTNPYILHTYLYSIENYKCHPDCVQEMVVKTSNKLPDIDINRMFEEFSLSLSELFLIHLVSADLCDDVYPLRDFKKDADKVSFSFDPVKLTSKSHGLLQDRLKELDGYVRVHRSEIDGYRTKLSTLGFCSRTYYLLFQGHIVANTLVKKHVQKVITALRAQR